MSALFKKAIPLGLAIVILSACLSPLSATETRVGSMGGIGFYIHDNSNIFYFPGAVYTYAGQVIGELRVKNDDNSYTIGVNYPYGQYSVIGAYLNRPVPIVLPAIVNNVTLNQTTDIFYGMQMTSYDLGFRLSVGLDSYKADIGTDELKESARYLALGVGLSNETMDLGLQFELPHAKHEFIDTTNTWSGFGFGLNARMFRGENTKLVPLVVFSYRGTNSKFTPGTGKIDYTDMNLGLGLGVNHQINENNLLVMAVEVVGLTSHKEKTENVGEITDNTTTIPGLYMGVESKIKTWLTGRIGAAQVYQSLTHKDKPEGAPETKSTTRSSQYKLTFGLGMNFGDFVLDAAINEGLFFDGPNFISGGINPMASRLSLTYKF